MSRDVWDGPREYPRDMDNEIERYADSSWEETARPSDDGWPPPPTSWFERWPDQRTTSSLPSAITSLTPSEADWWEMIQEDQPVEGGGLLFSLAEQQYEEYLYEGTAQYRYATREDTFECQQCGRDRVRIIFPDGDIRYPRLPCWCGAYVPHDWPRWTEDHQQ